MIVDCHTHIWQSPDQLGAMELGETPPDLTRSVKGPLKRRSAPPADVDHHWQSSSLTTRTIVLAFKSRYLKADIASYYVADYVSRYPDKLIGFAGIDPTESTALLEVRRARRDLRLRGLVVSPSSQDFHPTDSRAMRVYAMAEELGMPVVVHPAGPFTAAAKLEYARPYLLDEVARTFPRLRLVLPQLGWPWIDEALCMLAKHPSVVADISGLSHRPWRMYSALMWAHEHQVIDKLLFGSDFPYALPAECIGQLYGLNQITQGTSLPPVPREAIRGIIERDALGLLGIASA